MNTLTLTCPICKKTIENPSPETMASHIMKEHAKKKGGQQVVEMQVDQNLTRPRQPQGPNRATRRARARRLKPWQRVAQ